MLAVLVFAISSTSGRTATGAMDASNGSVMPASDISSLSPDEVVDRLFNRVMAAAEAGKTDSVAFFAPMAINSFQALGPLTPHRRYDMGLIHLAAGDPALARAEADTILTAEPNHLLGLILGMRAATATNDDAARKRFGARFLDRLTSERARGLQEYTDHATEIDAARAQLEADAKRPPAK